MSGDWIKMRVNLWTDPRVARICDATGKHESTVIGALYWLWSTADQHSEDGSLRGLSANYIDRQVAIKGFSSSLIEVGWLAESDRGVSVPEFSVHNGVSAKRRAVDARRQASKRKKSGPDADGCHDDTVTPVPPGGGNPSRSDGRNRGARDREENTPPKSPSGGLSADGSAARQTPTRREARPPPLNAPQQAFVAFGRSLGIEARSGESDPDFRMRVIRECEAHNREAA